MPALIVSDSSNLETEQTYCELCGQPTDFTEWIGIYDDPMCESCFTDENREYAELFRSVGW